MRATRYISAILCAVTLGAATLTVSAESQPVAKPDFVLAIDAGHGGHDKGCNSGTNYEKNITLDVAKRFQTLVEKACGDSVKVVMTRKT
ncbi:MAG: N-acetylmuramoyl-L-alanine amidase, partial [Muribaculaceae bacterium]|nr:N-acetylmuramoyl-L-alanine amidase [Muribaculaceae bacterium]